MVEPDLIDEVPTTLPLSSLALLRPFLPTTTPGWMPMETSDRWVPLPPDSMKLITALQVLCMMLSEPDATACMPGETPIDTVSISTPLAAKKPFLVATMPGQVVAVGETWPNETLVAALASSPLAANASMTTLTGNTTPSRKRIDDLLGSTRTLCDSALRAQARLRNGSPAIMILRPIVREQ